MAESRKRGDRIYDRVKEGLVEQIDEFEHTTENQQEAVRWDEDRAKKNFSKDKERL